jgi:hypothetical protein
MDSFHFEIRYGYGNLYYTVLAAILGGIVGALITNLLAIAKHVRSFFMQRADTNEHFFPLQFSSLLETRP